MTNQVYSYDKLVETNGWSDLTQPEKRMLAAFVIDNERINQNARYLELGLFAGGTLKFLKENTQTTQFTGVDLFEDFVITPENTHVSGTFRIDDVQRFLGDRVNLIKGDTCSIMQNMINNNEKFDFIFHDADHSYMGAKRDFELAQHLLKEDGQIAFHNASSYLEPDWHYVKNNGGGPWKLTQELLLSKEWRIIEEVDRLRIFSRR